MDDALFVGVDAGTLSVRAGVFDLGGRCLGVGVAPVALHRPRPDFAEQSGEQIWQAAGQAVRAAIGEAKVAPERVRGLGFDATCSLVVLDAAGGPVSVDLEGAPDRNVIVWMDHRATAYAERLSATGAEALRYVGGRLSPEMEVPKLAWLRAELPRAWDAIGRVFDLADYLVWRATGDDPRSVCTLACKWGYLAHESRFDDALWRAAGIDALLPDGRAGRRVEPLGAPAGTLSADAARHLGLAPHVTVAIGIIDAHAGGLGTLGAADPVEEHLAIIAGTSACHMAVSRAPCFVPGVWGPYLGAMVPGLWLSEGGQSAAGAALEHVVGSHARGAELGIAAGGGTAAAGWARLEAVVAGLEATDGAALTRGLHVLPDFLGNRSPRADAAAKGAIAGLGLDASVDALARLYVATLQALAYGTRHIVETMNAHGHRLRGVRLCGGGAKNVRWVAEHADVLGLPIGVVHEPDAMLLGSAMLAASAAGAFPGLAAAMRAMGARVEEVAPRRDRAEMHARRYEVFLRMYDDAKRWAEIERGDGAPT